MLCGGGKAQRSGMVYKPVTFKKYLNCSEKKNKDENWLDK
jgi:hypothetical protein